MLIYVDIDNVKIVDKPTLHKGEYGVHQCNFNFSEGYNGLVKIACFRSECQTYKVDIVNNTCDIPSEVLSRVGNVIVGVYAYSIENDNLLLRYSPVADCLEVVHGSYTDEGKTPEQVTPSQYEIYSKALNDGLNEAKASSAYTKAIGDQLLADKENGIFNGKNYEITESDYNEIASAVEKDIQPQLDEIKNENEEISDIVKNDIQSQINEIKNEGYVKQEDTEELVKTILTEGRSNWSEIDKYMAGLDYTLFGLGGQPRLVTGDWNSIEYGDLTGFFRGNSLKNAPTSTGWYYVLNIVNDGLNKKQIAFSFDSNALYVRTRVAGTWTSWSQII